MSAEQHVEKIMRLAGEIEGCVFDGAYADTPEYQAAWAALESAIREAVMARPVEPVATLHDDGCFTWKRDEYRLKYDRQRAGWRMDVYAAPEPKP